MTAPTLPSPPQTTRALLLRVAKTYVGRHWTGLLVAALCAALAAAATFYVTMLLKPFLNGMQPGTGPSMVLRTAGLIVLLGIGRALALTAQVRLSNRIGHVMVGEIQSDLLDRAVRADMSRLNATHTGGFVSSMLYDVDKVREATTTGLVNWTQNALLLLAMLGLMVAQDLGLMVLVLLAAPLAFETIRRYAAKTARAANAAMAETSTLSTAILESLDGVKVIKLENREAAERQRVGAVIARRQYFLIKGANARGLVQPTSELIMTILIAVILAYAGWRASTGHLTVGAFVTFLVALINAGQAVKQLSSVQTTLAEAGAAAGRLFEALDVPTEVADAPNAQPLPKGAATIAFDKVGFAYGEHQVLREVSLTAQRGETIALVGPSGGGKTTILNLIPRFYDASSGAVTIDGHDVRGVTMASLRDQIALVTQEPFLFDDTVRANIAYGKLDATDAQIEAAARAAAAHDFITALPEGYATRTGEAGARLSGGQRQRIAIARAFLKDAPILLLDEATSALDTESEAQVQAALERLMTGRTTIVIAHRLSTIRKADRIYVIEAGQIVETGAHAALVRKRGLYARLAASQNLEAAE
jgi:subfamily B ATP-binding cassette protein MsbA